MTNTYRKYMPWPSEVDSDFDDSPATDQEFARLDEWLATRPSRSNARRRSGQVWEAPPRTMHEPSGLPTPILAIDVDGPCSPFAMAKKAARRAGFVDTPWRSKVTYRRGSTWVPYSTLWLSREIGDMLAEFSRVYDVELVWASLWEHNANTIVAPAMGLPRLPVVSFSDHTEHGQWKYPAMIDYAAGRPLAWLDDSFNESRKIVARDRSGWTEARRNLPTLCHRVSASVGITDADLDAVGSWVTTARLAW